MRIGFIGLGRMGEPMARNLLRAGNQLTVYNRTRHRTDELRNEGARVAGSPAESAEGAELLVTMLADDRAVRSAVLGGDERQRPAIETLASGAVHMSSSTISIEISKELARAHRARGQGYIAVPMLGRVEAAREKKLWAVAAGPRNLLERCLPAIDALSAGNSIVGEEPWRANLVKIGVNFVLAAMLEVFGEAFALVEKHGMDAHQFVEVLNGGAFRSPVFAHYGARIADRRYQPAGFTVNLGLKDAELALEAAEAARVPLPAASILRDRYLQALAFGHGELDWAALAEISRINAGVSRSLRAGG